MSLRCAFLVVMLSLGSVAYADESLLCGKDRSGVYPIAFRQLMHETRLSLDGKDLAYEEFTVKYLEHGNPFDILVTVAGRGNVDTFFQFNSDDLTVTKGQHDSKGGSRQLLETLDCIKRDELLARVIKHLISVFMLNPESVKPETSMKDVIKSKEHAVVIRKLLKDEFCVDLTQRDTVTIETVRDLAAFVDNTNPDGFCRL